MKAALFATDEKLTFLDMQMYEDNILNLLKTAETYILKNINWRSEIVGIDREEVPEIPVAAIREILANSYAHAVYNSNTYHEICIYPNRVTIYSPGSFASTYSPEDYINKDLQSSIRNAVISKVLYLNKSIEQFGNACKGGHGTVNRKYGAGKGNSYGVEANERSALRAPLFFSGRFLTLWRFIWKRQIQTFRKNTGFFYWSPQEEIRPCGSL